MELAALEEKFRGQYFSEASADKATFLDEVGEHGIIHLATHALANAELGHRSAFFLSADYTNPMAAACRAGEVEQLQLDADLVVLSACETSRGSRLSSEGTVGISRAFSSAGARSLLSTLWAVDDKTTSEIVIDFYNELEKGASKSQALATAQANYRALLCWNRKKRAPTTGRPLFWWVMTCQLIGFNPEDSTTHG